MTGVRPESALLVGKVTSGFHAHKFEGNLVQGFIKSPIKTGLMVGTIALSTQSWVEMTYNLISGRMQDVADQSGGLAGLIGFAAGSTVPSEINRNFVAIDMKGTAISRTGALIGNFANPDGALNLTDTFFSSNILNASNSVGGLIGLLRVHDFYLASNWSYGKIVSASGQGTQLGGLVGFVQDLSNGDIQNNQTALTVLSEGSESGGLVGEITTDIDFSFLNISSNMIGGSLSGTSAIGGLVGKITTQYSVGQLSIINNQTISYLGNSITSTTGQDIGGLVGGIYHTDNASSSLSMSLATNTNNVPITAGTSGAGTGGIIGTLSVDDGGIGTLPFSLDTLGNTNTADIQSNAQSVSGFIGNLNLNHSVVNRQTLNLSTNSGNISSSDQFVGGLVGSLSTNLDLTMRDWTSTGEVSGSGTTGGLIGQFYNYAPNGYTTYLITSSYQNSGNGVTGGTNVGGLVGFVRTLSPFKVGTSFAEGNVTSTGGRAGGLVGSTSLDGGSFFVTGSHFSGWVRGAVTAGGITGATQGVNGTQTQFGGGSYSKGKVETTNAGLALAAGGIIGFNATQGAPPSHFVNISGTSSKAEIVDPNGNAFGLAPPGQTNPIADYWLKDVGINTGIPDDGQQRTNAQMTLLGLTY